MQGESLWLHLPIIKELAAMCHEVFAGGSITYAYTTIPTYPRWAGLLASLQANMQTVCTALQQCLNYITKAST